MLDKGAEDADSQTRHLELVSKKLISNINCKTTTVDNARLFLSFVKPLTGAGYKLSEAYGVASGMNHSSTGNDPYRQESRAHQGKSMLYA